MKSIVEMTRFLLSQPGSEGLFLLSEVISHDPLENYSGKQWARGGRHENPSLKQCVQNAVALQAQGNCQRKRHLSDGEPKIDIPLPKRKWSKTQKWLLYIASIVHTCIWNKLSQLRCHGDVTMVIQTHKWAMHICENSRFSYNSPMPVSLPNDFSESHRLRGFLHFLFVCLHPISCKWKTPYRKAYWQLNGIFLRNDVFRNECPV